MQIYDYLQDEISRKLYLARVNLSVTGDWDSITKLPMEYKSLNADAAEFYRRLYEDKGKKVIFGAGGSGRALARGFRDLEVECFIDNFCHTAEEVCGLPVYRPDKYLELFGTDYAKIIVSIFDRRSCAKAAGQLIDGGVKREDILWIPADWRNNLSQYFDVFVPHEGESFADCGCFDGGSAFRFAGWCGQLGYKKIWSFEPDPHSFEKCKKVLSVLDNCMVYPYGVSDHNGTVSFCGDGGEDSRIIADGAPGSLMEVQTVALDDFLKNETVSFIKMDVEGAEYRAIEGAAKIITEQKPRLAVSVYHKAEDIFSIPQLLLELRKDYRFYLRHYSLITDETVLYAE